MDSRANPPAISSFPTGPTRAGPKRPTGRGTRGERPIITARYVLRAEPIASAKPAEVVSLIAPTLQRYLTGKIEA